MTPSDHSEISPMRASDADRDRAAAIIGSALAEGRLTPEEHSQRLDLVYAARTHADLAPVTADLPVPSASESARAAVGSAVARPRIVAIFATMTRRGAWRPRTRTDVITVFGSAEIDLRDAVLPAREFIISASCVFGAVDVTVPPEMHVVDSGFAIFGARGACSDTPESAAPDAPVLRLTGACVFGAVEVKRKPREIGGGRAKQIDQR